MLFGDAPFLALQDTHCGAYADAQGPHGPSIPSEAPRRPRRARELQEQLADNYLGPAPQQMEVGFETMLGSLLWQRLGYKVFARGHASHSAESHPAPQRPETRSLPSPHIVIVIVIRTGISLLKPSTPKSMKKKCTSFSIVLATGRSCRCFPQRSWELRPGPFSANVKFKEFGFQVLELGIFLNPKPKIAPGSS